MNQKIKQIIILTGVILLGVVLLCGFEVKAQTTIKSKADIKMEKMEQLFLEAMREYKKENAASSLPAANTLRRISKEYFKNNVNADEFRKKVFTVEKKYRQDIKKRQQAEEERESDDALALSYISH